MAVGIPDDISSGLHTAFPNDADSHVIFFFVGLDYKPVTLKLHHGSTVPLFTVNCNRSFET